MAHDVFISHAREDKATADAVCAHLEGEGVRCWVAPRDILPGLNWGEAILDAIEGSRIMVVVLSSNANGSPQVRREVERAVNRDVIIIPFRTEDVPPSRALEYYLSTPHWLDALTPPLEKHIERLAATVELLLAGPGPASVAPPVAEGGPVPKPRRRRRALAAGAAIILAAGVVLVVAGRAWRRGESQDTWSDMVDRARELRQMGKAAEAVAAFAEYGRKFGESYPSTEQYVKTAQMFTMEHRALGVEGGAYIYRTVDGGAAARAGLAVGDIITGYGRHRVSGTLDYVKARDRMAHGAEVRLDFLRMDAAGRFEQRHVTVVNGPLGMHIMDI